MISFAVNPLFILDLRDDFIMNSSKKLYDFLGKDPIKAFHLGVHVTKWFESLDKKQMYLHSKLLRHNQEEIESYMDQMKHWTETFPHSSKDDQVNMLELSEKSVSKRKGAYAGCGAHFLEESMSVFGLEETEENTE